MVGVAESGQRPEFVYIFSPCSLANPRRRLQQQLVQGPTVVAPPGPTRPSSVLKERKKQQSADLPVLDCPDWCTRCCYTCSKAGGKRWLIVFPPLPSDLVLVHLSLLLPRDSLSLSLSISYLYIFTRYKTQL